MWSINSVYTWNRHGASFILLLPLFFVSSHKPVVYPSSQRWHPTWLRCLWICLWWHKTAGVWWNGWIRKVQQRSLWTTGNLSGSHVIYSALKKKETFSAVVRLDANIVLVSVMALYAAGLFSSMKLLSQRSVFDGLPKQDAFTTNCWPSSCLSVFRQLLATDCCFWKVFVVSF